MEIPWKSLSKSYVFGLSNTEHLRRNAQSCIRTSSPALRWWRGESWPCLFGNPSLMVWPPHTCCVWPCQMRQKYSCTVQSIIGLRHLPPQMKNQHGLNEEKNLIGENNLSIKLSEVNVWLVWILTTKRKSLKRVETCQRRHFNSWLFCYVNLLLELIFKWFYSPDIFPFDLFPIEPLIVHSYLNDVVLI
jgi:hypothetical protein